MTTEQRCTYCKHKQVHTDDEPCKSCRLVKDTMNLSNFEPKPQPTEPAAETPIGEQMGGE